MYIGKYFGIPHYLSFGFLGLLSFFVFGAIFAGEYAGLSIFSAVFTFVMLHEYGHIATCLWYNGTVNKVELNFLGGAAYIDYNKRDAFEELPIVIAGPLVNAVLAIIFLGLSIFVRLLEIYIFDAASDIGWLFDIFIIGCSLNCTLFVFNLLPIFPMDGGRALRAVTFLITGNFLLSTKIAVYTGITVAFICLVLSLIFYINIVLIFILIFLPLAGWIECQAEVEQAELNEKDHVV